MKASFWVLGLALAHFAASRWLFLISFGIGMSQFDIGQPLTTRQALVTHVSDLLDLPVAPLIEAMPAGWFPGLWGYIPFFLNSVVWGTAIYFGAKLYKRTRPVQRDV